MTEPRFSIIVPTFSRLTFLREAIDSILMQTLTDFEVIVINDGGESPSDSLPQDSRVRVIERPFSGGPAEARNVGIDAARGFFLVFLDDDDIMLPHRLELIGYDASVQLYCCLTSDLDAGCAAASWDPRKLKERDHPFHLGGIAIVRTAAPKFDSRYLACEDVDWWIRVSQSCRADVRQVVGYLIRSHDEQRGLHGEEARLRFSRQLLVDHSEFYRRYPKARAHRLKRIGLRELQLGNPAAARTAFADSFRSSPSARTAWHFTRAMAAVASHVET